MADTYTAVFSFTKPDVGGSRDAWGNKWNDNLDALDVVLDNHADAIALRAIKADVDTALALLAPKAGPAFTGNGQISGDWTVGGNMDVAGSLVMGDNFAFRSDLNTGWRRAGSDDWRLVAGGIDILRITPNGVFFLVNPSMYKIPAGSMMDYAGKFEPDGWFFTNGAAKSRATYTELDANIYCGDVFNPVANWGYRCTDPANPNSSRNTAGTHIVLPDYRGVPGSVSPDNMGGTDAGRLTFLGDNRNVIGAMIGANRQQIARGHLPNFSLAVSSTIVHPPHDYDKPVGAVAGGGGVPSGGFTNIVAGKTGAPPNTTASGLTEALGSGSDFNNVPLSNVAPKIIKY